jgi:hypothetical protein
MVTVLETPCWHSLALLLGLVYPSNNTKECQPIGHNVYRYYPQAHGSIVVAFHPEVFGYHSFIFSQRKAWCKVSSRDMDKITHLHNRLAIQYRGSHDKLKIVWHTHGPTSRIKGKTKNERMFLSGAGISNIAVQRIVGDHTYTWLRVRAMHEMGREATEYWSTSNLMWQFRFLTPTHQTNVGDYKGWTGLSPPTAYPSTREREMHPPIPLYPSTTPAYKKTTHTP